MVVMVAMTTSELRFVRAQVTCTCNPIALDTSLRRVLPWPWMTRWPVVVDPVFGCWLWQRQTDRDGYGISFAGKSRKRAHRAVYEERVGPIPDGMELEHDCRSRSCVNPEHLEPVTRSQNELRKAWAVRARRKVCRLRGHDMSVNAMVTAGGGRVCRACAREQAAP